MSELCAQLLRLYWFEGSTFLCSALSLPSLNNVHKNNALMQLWKVNPRSRIREDTLRQWIPFAWKRSDLPESESRKVIELKDKHSESETDSFKRDNLGHFRRVLGERVSHTSRCPTERCGVSSSGRPRWHAAQSRDWILGTLSIVWGTGAHAKEYAR